MEVKINVSDSIHANTNISEIEVNIPDLNQKVILDLDLGTIYQSFGLPNTIVLDFIFITSIIYVVDRITPRSKFADNWTRKLEVVLPVKNVDVWQAATTQINQLITFLTGDEWCVTFTKLESEILQLEGGQQILNEVGKLKGVVDKVSLFSGGLDSLIGAIDLLENNDDVLQLIGHYDGNISGVKNSQNDLYSNFVNHYPKRTGFEQIRVGFSKSSSTNKELGFEPSTRSRSLLFISLGIYVAESIEPRTNLVMPENGFISLNIPFTPSRRGSCSTRTTHPYILKNINELLSLIGIDQKVVNPYRLYTKGEMVSNVKNENVLTNLYRHSISCSKTGHKAYWIRRGASQCGVCFPCIIRRSALYSKSLDTETFGSDFCSNEVQLNEKPGTYKDIRDIINFLKNGYDDQLLSALLVTNAPSLLHEIDDYTNLVKRGLKEIEEILKNKGNRL